MKSKLKQNLVYNFLYQLFALIIPLITAPYVARIIGAEGLGIYSYWYSIALYFIYFAMLGLANYGNRIIAKNSETQESISRNFSSIYYFQVINCFIVIIAYLIFSFIFVKENKLISEITTITVLSSIFDVSWLFFGLQEFKITTIRQFIVKIIVLISIFTFVRKESDLPLYTLIMALSYFISSFTLWLMMWKKISFKKIQIKEFIKHYKPCLVLFIPVIATALYRLMDKVMLGKLSTMLEVGYYESAEKMILVSSGLMASICTVMMPKISNLLSQRKINESRNLFNKSLELCMFLGFALSFGIASVSREFIPVFFGNGFESSINISKILCISFPFLTWSMVIRNLYLIPHEKDKIYLFSTLYGSIINFLLNIYLIPKLDSIGATIATICAEIFIFFYQTFYIYKDIDFKKNIIKVTRFFVSGIIMYYSVRLFSYVTSNIYLNLIIEIIIGAIVYILFCIIFTYLFHKDDFYLYKNIIKNKVSKRRVV